MTTQERQPHWFHLTPARFFIGLLVVQVFLLLSERFQWFAFNERKGWTVLIAVGVVGGAVLAMLVWALVCLVLRRRFQFGVRSLLLFLVVLSIPLGWFAWEMDKARRQREAVERIVELGGSVGYDYQVDANGDWVDGAEPTTWLRKLLGRDFFYDVVSVHCPSTSFGNGDTRNLKRLPKLEFLSLNCPQVTDPGLVHLKGLTNLEVLYLSHAKVTDAGLKHLEGLTSLRVLGLHGTKVTGDGLEHLKRLTNLERLGLGGSQVGDAGLEHLKALPYLQHLEIHDTQVTDAGIPYLRGLTALESLAIHRNEVTDAGLEDLAKLPNLHYVSIGHTQVTMYGVWNLQLALPTCIIEHPEYRSP
jgi:hypothetical protein